MIPEPLNQTFNIYGRKCSCLHWRACPLDTLSDSLTSWSVSVRNYCCSPTILPSSTLPLPTHSAGWAVVDTSLCDLFWSLQLPRGGGWGVETIINKIFSTGPDLSDTVEVGWFHLKLIPGKCKVMQRRPLEQEERTGSLSRPASPSAYTLY